MTPAFVLPTIDCLQASRTVEPVFSGPRWETRQLGPSVSSLLMLCHLGAGGLGQCRLAGVPPPRTATTLSFFSAETLGGLNDPRGVGGMEGGLSERPPLSPISAGTASSVHCGTRLVSRVLLARCADGALPWGWSSAPRPGVCADDARRMRARRARDHRQSI